MGSALGTTAPRPFGSRWADIRDYGALPVSAGGVPATNRIAIQAAVDALGAVAPSGGGAGTVFVPSGDWLVYRPIFFDQPQVGILGEANSISRLITPDGHDGLVFGIARKPLGVTLTAAHVPDVFTAGPGGTCPLDTTAVNALGQRWALRTMADCHIVQQGGAFDVGNNYYKAIRQLTVEFAVDLSKAPGTGQYTGGAPSTALFGMCRLGDPSPWMVGISGGSFQVQFRTASGPGVDVGVNRSFGFGTIPSNPGFYRVAFQIDLVNAAISGFVNGNQAPISSSALGADFLAASNLTFAPNQDCPFGLGSLGLAASGLGDGWLSGGSDLAFFGLKVSSALAYLSNGTGSPQARVDGATVNDSNRFFRYDSATLGVLGLADTPAQLTLDRVVTISGRSSTPTTAYFLDNVASCSPYSTLAAGEVRNIAIQSGVAGYGRAVVTGWSNGLAILDSSLSGGCHGLGSLNLGANYPLTVSRCSLTGADAAIYLYYSSFVSLRDISLQGAYRAGIRLFLAQVSVDNLFAPNYGNPDFAIKAVESSIDTHNANWDNEGINGGAAIAHYYVSASSYLPIPSIVNLRSDGTGSVLQGAVLIYLDDKRSPTVEDAPGFGPCTFSCRDFQPFNNGTRSLVTVVGQRWQGDIDAVVLVSRPQWIESINGPTYVTSRHRRQVGPPRDGTWTANGHLFEVTNPATAQFTQWRCTATGAYGTPVPPTWAGFVPLDDGLSLAAYISDSSYWAQSSAPTGSAGFWTNGVFDLTLNALFGGPALSLPAAIYAGLGERNASRYPLIFEPPIGVNGYARVALSGAAFATSGGGTTSVLQAINFPTATGTWLGTNSGLGVSQVLLLYSAATGGNVLAAMDIAPIPIASGVAPKIPANTVSLARSALSPQGSFADRVHDWVNNAYLKAQAFAVPSIYLALSTAPASITAAPSEPSGGGYARVATSSSSWTRAANPGFVFYGSIAFGHTIRNATSLTFPSPSGNWGTVQSVYLMDAASGGNILAAANLTIPRTINNGDPARSFAPGALWITRS
jgi:hypothetical protein